MRIENLSSEKKASRARVSATVIWEDCDRPTREIFFETDEAFAQDLSCNPHAFLIASILLAMRHGEERIAIDEAICPELRNGLMTVMGWLCTWYGPPRKPVRIEAKAGARLPFPRAAQQAGAFLSGGIDSLATLRTNRLDFPPDHPRYIRDCLLLHGFDIGGTTRTDRQLGSFERAVDALSAVAADAHVTLIPVSTNVRQCDDDDMFSLCEFQGAILSSVAHALSNRLSAVSIASSSDFNHVRPWGSHPLLDPNYSCTDLQILHDGLRFTRLEKVRLVADWDVALQNMRVCTSNTPGLLNCGKCEKCIRTMTELLAIGKLGRAHAFPVNDVSAELLASIDIATLADGFYSELIPPLTELGRLDLVKVIESKLAQFRKHLAWEQEQDWKGVAKRFDRRFLGSGVYRSYKVIRERALKS
jgi:hypothetical protein